MKRLLLVVVLSIVLNAAASAPQITTGTNTGIVGVRIAVPEFQPATPDVKTASRVAIFNQVLWDDLDYSGGVTLVSRSLYPLGKFTDAGDIKPEDWTAP